MMKRGVVFALALATVFVSVSAPIAVRNWPNLMDMRISGEDRVKRAFNLAEPSVKNLCREVGLAYPPKRIFLRAFKSERELEVWGSNKASGPLKRIQTYTIAGMSGKLGPKRKEGDLQVPEGVYHIDRFNPQSRFRLSLGINYPNASDRKLSDKAWPGGDIFIHGDTRSIGCLAMTDEKIDEIYVLALQAKRSGQSKIPVHLFPFRITGANILRFGSSNQALSGFWNDLEPIYDSFEDTKRIPRVVIDAKGRYTVEE